MRRARRIEVEVMHDEQIKESIPIEIEKRAARAPASLRRCDASFGSLIAKGAVSHVVINTRAMMKRAFVILLLAVAAEGSGAPPDVSTLKNLQWREVGPYRGGRADASKAATSRCCSR